MHMSFASLLSFLSEPIQSRCAMLRYGKLSDAQVLARLIEICREENVSYAADGLEALIFSAQGDMRQVFNQQSNVSTYTCS